MARERRTRRTPGGSEGRDEHMRVGGRTRAMLAALVGATLLLAPGTPAGAQDPYGGSTTSTAGPGPETTCRLREDTSSPGATATARVQAAPRDTEVQIRFDGVVVAEEMATGPGQSPQVNIDIDFVVPEDAEPGDHDVSAVGAGFSVSCGTLTVQSETTPAGFSRDGGSGSAAKSGIYVAIALAVLAALVMVRRSVLDASRQRARAAQSRRPRGSSRP